MKLYGEEEIGAILKKASEKSSVETDSSVGLTVDELKQLATDAGIDPDQVEKAIAELDAESGVERRSLLGGPFSFDGQVMLDREVSAAEWEEMLIEIRKTFGSEGVVGDRESSFEWTSPWGSTNSASVTAVKSDGKTKIGVRWAGPMTAVPFYVPVPLAAIAALPFASEFLELGAVPGMSFVLLVSGLTFLAGRWGLTRHIDKLFGRFRSMMTGFQHSVVQKDANTELVANDPGEIQNQIQSRESRLNLDDAEPGQGMGPDQRGRSRSR